MLRISRRDYDAVRKHCEQAYPKECCGVMLGKLEAGERVVHQVLRCDNASKQDHGRHYSIQPEDLIAAQKKAREQGLDIVGFYHSHPDAPARWSESDLREAHWFACSYLITSVEAGIASRSFSFVLAGTDDQDKRFDDENVEMLDSATSA